MKYIILYHNDLDGVASAAIVRYYLSRVNNVKYDDMKFLYVDHGTNDLGKRVSSLDSGGYLDNGDTMIFLLDYSFSDHNTWCFDRIRDAVGDNFIWIDHHKTSLEFCETHKECSNVKGVRKCELNPDKTRIVNSGASTTWEFLWNGGLNEDVKTIFDYTTIPLFVHLVTVWDCWLNDLNTMFDMAKNFKLAMDEYLDPCDTIWKQLIVESLSDDSITSLFTPLPDKMISQLISDGERISTFIDNQNRKDLENRVIKGVFEGIDCVAINKLGNSDMFCHYYDKYPLCIAYAQLSNRRWKYSLYSNDQSVDCSIIAQRYGGGGHRGAAGFTYDTLLPFLCQ